MKRISIQIESNEDTKIKDIETFLKGLNMSYTIIDEKFVTTVKNINDIIYPSIDEFDNIEDYFKSTPKKKRKPKFDLS